MAISPKKKPLSFGRQERRTPHGKIIEVEDSGLSRIRAADLFVSARAARDGEAHAATLATQMVTQNRGLLGTFGASADVTYNGRSAEIVLKTGTKIGALPLISPLTGKPDYGLVIKPRFPWAGVGLMLGAMGWKVSPSLVRLPLLPQSDRKVPAWVLSTVILVRIAELLAAMTRKFDFTLDTCPAPKGTVLWAQYATQQLPAARFLNVPCRFPDLRDDQTLLAAIHYTLRRQLVGLEGQRQAGGVVLQLLDLCHTLLSRVQCAPPRWPSRMVIDSWFAGPFKASVFRDGIQAMEWTVDERGLAGIGDLQGLPWVMSMETFFEAWVETVVVELAKRIGGTLRVGRKRETIAPVDWEPPYSGSQRYLAPDVVLEREDETIVFDAKYKRHWEDINWNTWVDVNEEIKEQHRHDFMQVLAYSTLSDAKKNTCCLVYPCLSSTMESLRQRGRTFHRAYVGFGSRRVKLLLLAVPMHNQLEDTLATLAEEFRRPE
ncbi:MAG: hypothetical protein DDT38_01388 [Firmicutes bacterium]|nr:hypothetical protein [candidate division NPL-UPA2 bacterium]